MVERITDRIYKIAVDELPKQSLGLEVLGLDVCWGNWSVVTPQGQPAKKETLALLIAVRRAGPRGEVLLGNQPPVTNAHILSGLWPSEQEVRTGIAAACQTLRDFITQQAAPGNGQAVDPLAAFRPKHQG